MSFANVEQIPIRGAQPRPTAPSNPAGLDDQLLCLQPWVVHSIPGRVRLRFAQGEPDRLRLIADRLQAHPDVLAVTVSEPNRSLTVSFDRPGRFADLVGGLPERPSASVAGGRPQIDWRRVVASGLLAAIPLGTVGHVALHVAVELVEQVRKQRTRPDSLAPSSLPGGYASPQSIPEAVAS